MVLVALFCAANIFASTYKTTQFYHREKTARGWTEWVAERSDMRIDLEGSVLTIYSPIQQTYQIYSPREPYRDAEGDERFECYFIDQDGDKGRVEFIYRNKTNTAQVYIRFSNIQWAYDLIPY